MFREGNLRASDADRELAVSMLQRAAAEGRLDHDELDERVQRALVARTYAELAETVIDLPLPPDPARSGRRRRPEPLPAWASRGGRGRSLRMVAGTTIGGWMLRAVRHNPSLLIVLVPLLALAATFALCFALLWLTVVAVAMMAGVRGIGPGRRRAQLRRRRHSAASIS
jgi:hypothetical protein